MNSSVPLAAFPLTATRNVEMLEETVRRYYGDIKFSLPHGPKGFHGISNHCQLQSLGLTYASNGAAMHIEFSEFNYFGQLYSVRGSARAGKADVDIDAGQAFVGNASDPLILDYAPGFEHMVIKFDAGALVRRLEAIAGNHVIGKLKFDPSSPLDRPEAEHLQRSIWFLVDRIDTSRSTLHPLALAEFEQALAILFLTANRHNHSRLLFGQPSSIAPWQVRRAEEYIEANWDQPVSVEALAIITGASARSIFHSFKKYRNYSPMEFVKHVRLQHARQMLTNPGSDASVTSIAFACGFGNLGHFAHYYDQKFGERPSETLRRTKGMVRGGEP